MRRPSLSSTRGRGRELADQRGLITRGAGIVGFAEQQRDLLLEQSEQLGRIEALLARIAAAAETAASR